MFKRLNKSVLLLLAMVILFTGCTSTTLNDNSHDVSKQEVTDTNVNPEDKIVEVSQDNKDNPESPNKITNGDLEVHFIDVGQGDAVLIKQNGHNMLIDAGDNHKGQIVTNYIREEGVKSLDYVVGTHPHSDHIGGLDDVVSQFDVKSVIMPDKTHTTKTFEDVLDAISIKGLKIQKTVTGKSYELGNAKFTILGPSNISSSNLNNYSVSLKLEYGDNSFIFTGDAEAVAEQDIISSGINLQADVMKAGHHGSNTSNSDALLSKIDPEYVVIQVAETNKYNHPDRDIIDKFEDRGIEVYRNDLHGSVIVKSDGKNIEVETNKDVQSSINKPKNKPVINAPQEKHKPVQETPTIENITQENKQTSENHVGNYIGTTTTKKFHKDTCRHVSKEENRAYFSSLQEALDNGYIACKVCNPQ